MFQRLLPRTKRRHPSTSSRPTSHIVMRIALSSLFHHYFLFQRSSTERHPTRTTLNSPIRPPRPIHSPIRERILVPAILQPLLTIHQLRKVGFTFNIIVDGERICMLHIFIQYSENIAFSRVFFQDTLRTHTRNRGTIRSNRSSINSRISRQ
jgi:hypothetical protein